MDTTALNQTDHDLVIRMDTTMKLGIADLKTDIAQVNTNIAELKGNFTTQFATLDTRIKTLETLAATVNAPEALKKLQKHEDFVNDYLSTHKEQTVTRAWWVSVASLAIAALSALGNILKLHL